jgi:fumarylpyruvate hydrolase
MICANRWAGQPCSATTPAERAGHLAKGRIWLSVNGKVRQDADLDPMIWKVPDIIAVLSTQVGLAAGDLIYTGTPARVGAIVKGDTLVGNMAGLDELTIRVV